MLVVLGPERTGWRRHGLSALPEDARDSRASSLYRRIHEVHFAGYSHCLCDLIDRQLLGAKNERLANLVYRQPCFTWLAASSVLTATRAHTDGRQSGQLAPWASTLDDHLMKTPSRRSTRPKAHLDLESASRVSVTSYNGIVLLRRSMPRRN